MSTEKGDKATPNLKKGSKTGNLSVDDPVPLVVAVDFGTANSCIGVGQGN